MASKMKQIKTLLFLFLAASLAADEQLTHQIGLSPQISPWFTGPLVAGSAYTVAPPHWSLEPFLYYTVYTGTYDRQRKAQSTPNFYSTMLQLQAKRGLISGLDFQFYPQVVYNETKGKALF